MTLCGTTVGSSGSVAIKNTSLLTRLGEGAINCSGNDRPAPAW